jgi:hypothetical protein
MMIRGSERRDLSSSSRVDNAAGVLVAVSAITPMPAQGPITIDSRFAEVSGIKLHI